MLEKMQQDFLNAFYTENSKEDFTQYIKINNKLSPSERLDIYQGSITEGMARALHEIYPVCEKLVGEEFFSHTAYHFIAATPSNSPNLFEYGASFPGFIAAFKPAQALPYLADVARLELALHLSYYAENTTLLEAEKLANLDQEKVVFLLPKHSSLIHSAYPIYKIWQVNQPGYEGEQSVNLNEGENHLFIYKKNTETKVTPLTTDQWRFLQALNQEKPFAEICQSMLQSLSETEFVTLVQQATQLGWINKFRV